MPARNAKGQFTSNPVIPLPGFLGIYKIIIIIVLLFPWYAILSNKNIANNLFRFLLGNDFQKECPAFDCSKCEGPINCPNCLPPNQVCPVCPNYDDEFKKALSEWFAKMDWSKVDVSQMNWANTPLCKIK